MLSRKEGFSAREEGRKMDGREGVVENGGTRFPRVEIFIPRKLVEWKSFPFDVLMDYICKLLTRILCRGWKYIFPCERVERFQKKAELIITIGNL